MIKKNHVLSNLRIDEGFDLAPAEKDIGFTHIELSPDVLSNLESGDEIPGFRPLRDIVPFTKGRAVEWKLKDHVMSAKARNWPMHKPFEFHNQSICICGGGPSLGPNLDKLRSLQKSGAKVMAINRTGDYLLGLPKSHGMPWIKPWACILLESIPNAANYIAPRNGIRYYIGSQCHPDTFDKFEPYEHFIWHAQSHKIVEDCLTDQERKHMVPSVGSTCGLRAIIFAYMLGFKKIHLFGFDSCYNDEEIKNGICGLDGAPRLHSYEKKETIHDIKELVVRGFDSGRDRQYWGNGNMLAQADEFQRFIKWRNNNITQGRMDNHDIIVHGFGLIPDIARQYGLHSESKQNERKAA